MVAPLQMKYLADNIYNNIKYYVKTKSGKWGMIAYSNEIHSVMIGHKRGRFTGGMMCLVGAKITQKNTRDFCTQRNCIRKSK